jgi:hypothetical protein
MVLRGGTEIAFKTQTELSSSKSRQGDRFNLTVSDDVLVNGQVVIPRGSLGVGEISFQEGTGAFGKAGKLGTRILYVKVGDMQIPLTGQSDEKGKSGTTGTVVAIVLVGVFAAFVTGKTAVIPAGSTMVAYVEKDLPIVVGAPVVQAVLVVPSAPAAASVTTPVAASPKVVAPIPVVLTAPAAAAAAASPGKPSVVPPPSTKTTPVSAATIPSPS